MVSQISTDILIMPEKSKLDMMLKFKSQQIQILNQPAKKMIKKEGRNKLN